MKLFGKELKPKLFAEPKKKTITSKEIGGTGTPIFSGIISGEEYLPELQYRQALVIYDQMRKGDATVGAALLVCKLPILGAKWFVEPASEDPQDKMIADFVEKCLMELSETGWQDFLRQSLLMLDFGYMVFEKVFQVVEYEYDGDDLKVPRKEYIGWKKFAARLPKSIYRWEMSPDKATGKARAGVTQILPQGGTPEIPMESLLLFINNKEGDNYNGVSILRNAYKHWYFKDNFYKLDAIGFEKQSVGIPTLALPDGFDDKDKERAEELLSNIRANEKMFMVYPNSWVFDFADMKGHSLKDPSNAIEHHDQLILKSVLAQFLNLGGSKTGGSRALSADHSDIFFEALKATARHLSDVINKHAIPQLVDLNFNVTNYPKLSFAKIGKVDLQAYGSMLNSLATSGLITPDKTLEEYLREQLELPDMADPVDYEAEGGDEVDENGVPIPKPTKPGAQANGVGKVKTDATTLQKDNPAEDKNEAPEKQPNSENNSQFRNRASEVKKKSSSRVRLSEGDIFIPWRPLTFAEKKVNFQSIQDHITDIENRFKVDAKDVLRQAVDPLILEFKQHIQDKNMDGIKNISLPYKNIYAATVQKYLRMPYEFGKKNASAEMKVMPPATPTDALNRIKMQSDMIADLHENDIVKAMKLKAIDTLKKIKASEPAQFAQKNKKNVPIIDDQHNNSGYIPEVEIAAAVSSLPITDAFETAMESMTDEMGDLIDTMVDNTAVLTTGMLFNQGRREAQDYNSSKIYALQRSEVLDEKCCDFCLSMDGLVLSMSDPATNEEEYHSNCRGMWVEIMNDEAELPDIEEVPEDISQYYGGLNDIKKMPAPIVKNNSPAGRYLKTGDFKSK